MTQTAGTSNTLQLNLSSSQLGLLLEAVDHRAETYAQMYLGMERAGKAPQASLDGLRGKVLIYETLLDTLLTSTPESCVPKSLPLMVKRRRHLMQSTTRGGKQSPST